MQVVSLEIDTTHSGFANTEVEDKFLWLLGLLYDSRQIANPTPVPIKNQNHHKVSVQVTIPEVDALNRDTTAYVQAAWRDVERLTANPILIHPIGVPAGTQTPIAEGNSSFYILMYRYFSPLVCGDSGRPVPLYRIPPTDDYGRAYDSIRFWENCYERLHGLWLGSGVGESFALRQLQNFDSGLSRQGRELCAKIEDLTGTPTYYHLFNYRGWSAASDRARLCPETGMPWLVEGATEADFIAFKSDEARLTSELSTNCRY